MKKKLTKTHLTEKYDDAKREILRLHEEISELRKKASDAAVGVEQLRRVTNALLMQVVLTYGTDTGSGRELYISSAAADTLQSWRLTALRTETAGMLKLRAEPRGSDFRV